MKNKNPEPEKKINTNHFLVAILIRLRYGGNQKSYLKVT